MTIILNNYQKEVPDGSTLESIVVAELGQKRKGIAVAVNQTVIAGTEREKFIVKPHDSILIIKATQGG